jgi:hypothetical protein
MHHHDKHAASKDGHRPDDPHGVTNPWKQQQIDAIMAESLGGGIRREGHEVFDEGTDYGQRVSAFGNVERNLADQQIESRASRPRPDSWSGTRPVYEPSEGYGIEGDEAVDVMEGEEDQAFAKKAMYGQDFEGHVGANEYLGMGSPEGNAEGKRRQSEGAVKKARAGESYPESWQTGDPDRLSVPASKVLGHDNHQQLMIDASSTGGGESDSHMIPFTSTPDNIGMLKEGKWRAEGKRNKHTGNMQWNMHPDAR